MMNLSCSLPPASACHIILYHQHSPWIYICSFFSGSFIKLEAERAQDIDSEELCFSPSTSLLNSNNNNRQTSVGLWTGMGIPVRGYFGEGLGIEWGRGGEAEMRLWWWLAEQYLQGKFQQPGNKAERERNRSWVQVWKCWFLRIWWRYPGGS